MRRTPQQERGQRRVQQILDAAAEVFAEVGYEVATTNMIAQRANTSIGSLYQFFPNKDSIVKLLARRMADDFATELTPAGEAGECPHKIDNFVEEIYRFSLTHTGFVSLLHGPVYSAGSIRAYSHLHEKLQQYVQAMLASENGPPKDPVPIITIRIAICCTAAVLGYVTVMPAENRAFALDELKRTLKAFLCTPGQTPAI